MGTNLRDLESARIPGFPDARITLDNAPLRIVDDSSAVAQNLTSAIGIATVLYRWCPDALYAFLDLDAWFSFTWSLTIQDEVKIEIGRVRDQVTFGTLSDDGENWKLMITYTIAMEGSNRGAWVPNTSESMLDDKDITDAAEIDRLGSDFVKALVSKERWSTGRKMKHQLFVEYAPMDIWGDGIAMNPHWLYKPLNLSECSLCGRTDKPLQRCGRCGTATYCSGACQKLDWAVHKAVCNLELGERGQMLHLTQRGGLIAWDTSKTVGDYEGQMSTNPNFVEPQPKRRIDTSRGVKSTSP